MLQPRFGCEKPATVNSLSCHTALGSSKCGSAASGLATSQLLQPRLVKRQVSRDGGCDSYTVSVGGCPGNCTGSATVQR